MINSTASGIGNALYMQRKFQLKKEMYNDQSSLNMVYEDYTYDTILSIINNKYKIIHSNTLPLQFIVFIGINQYLLDIFNELYLCLFISCINDNYKQMLFYEYVNNKANKSKDIIIRIDQECVSFIILY